MATRRLAFHNRYPRRHGVGKYHSVILLPKHIWSNTVNREAICSVAVPMRKTDNQCAVSPRLRG